MRLKVVAGFASQLRQISSVPGRGDPHIGHGLKVGKLIRYAGLSV